VAAASSSGTDAVGSACRRAVESLGGEVGLLLAFASGELDFDRSAGAIQEAAGPDVPNAGLTGKGLITAAGPLDEGCVAMAFGPQLKAAVGASPDASADLRSAGRDSTAEALAALDGDADLVLLFIDSTRGDIADTVSGAYEAAGPAVPLAGGAAGGAEKRHFHMGRATSDSVVAVALSSSGPMAVGHTQTSRAKGDPSLVTRSDGQRIEEIDGRPAEEVYLEQLGLGGVALDDEEFEALAITHPLAQPELHGDVRLRHVMGRAGDGSILSGTHIPSGAAIEFTELEFEELLSSGGRSVTEASEALGSTTRAALVFDCAGRRRALREGLGQEVEAITAALGESPPPLAGLYTHGEVARLQGAKGDRNHAVVTVAFG
jgi:methyl-accepting chemotaxis protein